MCLCVLPVPILLFNHLLTLPKDLGTDPNFGGNRTYKCPDVGQEQIPCIKNHPFQTSLGPDGNTTCTTFSGDRCQSDTALGTLQWPGNGCMKPYGSFLCWKSERVAPIDAPPLPSVSCPSSTSEVRATRSAQKTVSGAVTSRATEGGSRGGSHASGTQNGKTSGDVGATGTNGGSATDGASETNGPNETNGPSGTAGATTGQPNPSGGATRGPSETGNGVNRGTSEAGGTQPAGSPTGPAGPSTSGANPPKSSQKNTLSGSSYPSGTDFPETTNPGRSSAG